MTTGKKIAAALAALTGTAVTAAGVLFAGFMHYLNRPERYSPLKVNAQNVKLIAHRGMSSLAPENTTASFELAGRHNFWGAECDIYRSADGKWIVSHDPNTFRMMNGAKRIEAKTFDELSRLKINRGSDIKSYSDLKICTLDEYLSICKRYDMTAIIEVKGKNNTEHYSEVIDAVDSIGAKAIFISFHFSDLVKLRELTEAPLYLLVLDMKEEHLELVKTLEGCGIDFNGNRPSAFKSGLIEKCIDENIPLISWTINEAELFDKLVKTGIEYITTDRLYPE